MFRQSNTDGCRPYHQVVHNLLCQDAVKDAEAACHSTCRLVGRGNDRRMVHDISYCVVTKTNTSGATIRRRGLSLVILRGKIGTLCLLKDLLRPLFCVLDDRVFLLYTSLETFGYWKRKSWRTTSISNNTINHDWRRHLGRCATTRGSGAYPGIETNLFPTGYARLSIRHPELMDRTGDIVVPGIAQWRTYLCSLGIDHSRHMQPMSCIKSGRVPQCVSIGWWTVPLGSYDES
jgi:hypothetical protein